MLLTFKTLLEQIIIKQKYTTIRPETPSRNKHWERKSDAHGRNWLGIQKRHRVTLHQTEWCHLWWQNPRNRSIYCRKIGAADLLYIEKTLGMYLDEKDANADGFNSREELIDTLMVINNMTFSEVMDTTWFIYRWDDGFSLHGYFKDHMNGSKEKPCMNQYCPACKEGSNV